MESISTGAGMGTGVETINITDPASEGVLNMWVRVRSCDRLTEILGCAQNDNRGAQDDNRGAQDDNGVRCWASSAIMANSVITLGGSISPLSSR
jgi:hypothetical protein